MYTPVVVGIALLVYGVTCFRAWNTFSKREDGDQRGQWIPRQVRYSDPRYKSGSIRSGKGARCM